MRPNLLILATLLGLTTACGRETSPDRTEQVGPSAPRTEAPTAPDVLRIDPSMLPDLRMTTAAVEERSASTEVDMLGEIGVNRDTYAEVAPPIDAQVVRLLVGVNSVVRQSEPLAELRSPELGRARAELLTAEARAKLAAQAVERKRTLAAERIVAARELQEAESQQEEAQAGLRAARSTLRAIGAESSDEATAADPSRFLLRSPIRGTVLERRAAVGQLAQSDTAMFRIADLARVWLTVHAFERDAVQLQPKMPVRITLAALPGREFRGAVSAIGHQVDPSSRTLDVRVDLPNPDGTLRPGMSATAHVPLQGGAQRILAVPAPAVQRVGEDWMVFSPHGEGSFQMHKVGRGRDLGSEIEVVRGVQAGDTVVVDGAFLLKAEAEKAVGGDDHGHEN